MWQHGPLAILNGAALFCLVRGHRRQDWRWLGAAGIPFGLAYTIRPTAAVPLILTAAVLLFINRRALLLLSALAAVVIVPAIAYNIAFYGTPTVPVYGNQVSHDLNPALFKNFVGVVLSPSRGLLIYSPFLALIGIGIWIRRRSLGGLDIIVAGSIVVHAVLVANSASWEGGASYGSRYMTDMLPFFAYFLVPVVAMVARPPRLYQRSHAVLAAALAVTFGFSTFVHAQGATNWDTQLWNSQPHWFTEDPDRHWDWNDAPFLRFGDAAIEDLYPSGGLPAPAQLCQY